jgi:hypothetical protein
MAVVSGRLSFGFGPPQQRAIIMGVERGGAAPVPGVTEAAPTFDPLG